MKSHASKVPTFPFFWNFSPKIPQGIEWGKESKGKKVYNRIPCSIKFFFSPKHTYTKLPQAYLYNIFV